MDGFEIFRGRSYSGGRCEGPTVTTQPRGKISFSVDAMEMLGHPEAVLFLVNREKRLLGFKKAARGDQDAAVVSAQRNVSAMPVCRHLGIDVSGSVRRPLVMIGGVPVIDLEQPGISVTSNRRNH